MLIERANPGDAQAMNAIFAAFIRSCTAWARARLRRSAPFTLLDTTALLHESYLRLVKLGALRVENRGHFLACAAPTMRAPPQGR
ncbi:MAG: ECF-type sigma factor [Casimicrobiaceae bacterium]